ncbi:MAG: response regulator [Gemmatales bacterium]|nr:response regulator [Gemmatales bacterium]MDW8387054.1 response regulator [Gemmatales bacterium]
MPTVLVVDDSAVDRKIAGSQLEKLQDVRVLAAGSGNEALELIQRHAPDVVVTDLQMGEMDGLQLVTEIRKKHPHIPVILMTAHGSEEIAVAALQRGAASYVPKRNLAQDLCDTVENVLNIAQVRKQRQRLLDCWVQSETQYLLENDLTLIPPLIAHLQEKLGQIGLCDETGMIRVAVALHEAMVNAIVHGNLEIKTPPGGFDEKTLRQLVAERRQMEAYRDRRITVIVEESRSEAAYVIQDEGPGFDPHAVPEPSADSLDRTAGRGLLLIRTFMDEVFHNESGNQITMIKRRDV